MLIYLMFGQVQHTWMNGVSQIFFSFSFSSLSAEDSCLVMHLLNATATQKCMNEKMRKSSFPVISFNLVHCHSGNVLVK